MNVLFIGAHADDIELGAAGLVARMLALGHRVYFLVLTDDATIPQERREEAVAGAAALGVPGDCVHFGGFRDGYLRATAEEIGAVRELAYRLFPEIDVVVCH